MRKDHHTFVVVQMYPVEEGWGCKKKVSEEYGGEWKTWIKKRGLKANTGKNKVMVLGGEERLECKVCIDGIRLEHVSEFKYLGCVLDEPGADESECSRKVASRRKVAVAIRSLVKAKSL